MAKKKLDTPFDKIMDTRNRLRLYVEYGDIALDGKTPVAFCSEVIDAFDYLMSFRNIINGMVGFNEAPERAALAYIPRDMIEDASA